MYSSTTLEVSVLAHILQSNILYLDTTIVNILPLSLSLSLNTHTPTHIFCQTT